MKHNSKVFQNKIWMMTLILLVAVLCSLNLALASEYLTSKQEDIHEGNTSETSSREPAAGSVPSNGSNSYDDPNSSEVEPSDNTSGTKAAGDVNDHGNPYDPNSSEVEPPSMVAPAAPPPTHED